MARPDHRSGLRKAAGLAEKLRYLVRRHPFLYRLRYALITELGGCDFAGRHLDPGSAKCSIPREFSDLVARKGLLGDDGMADAQKIAFDLSHGHQRGPGLGHSSVDTLKRIYSGERAGVCSDYCQVFLGLCRAAGIEAREWGLCARFDAHVVGHALTEVYSEQHGKWTFLDPFFSIYALRPGDPRPLAVTEMIDLATEGRAGEIQLVTIDPDAVKEELRQGYVGRFFKSDHAFFLLTDNDVFGQDRFLRWMRVVPLPVLHMFMILTGNYQKFHVYTNPGNEELMARRLAELEGWLRRRAIAALALLALLALVVVLSAAVLCRAAAAVPLLGGAVPR